MNFKKYSKQEQYKKFQYTKYINKIRLNMKQISTDILILI